MKKRVSLALLIILTFPKVITSKKKTTKNKDGTTVITISDTPSSSSSSSPSPSTSTSEPSNPCTPGHCSHCHPSPTKHCTKCTNGFLIDKSDQPGCTTQSNIPNCRSGDPLDPSDPDICSECQRGFKLVDKSECVKDGSIHNCDWPFWSEDNIFCRGCIGMFLASDYSKCISTTHTDHKFPQNCKYGGRSDEGGCLMCEDGYDLTSDKSGCVRSVSKGCKEFRNNDPYFCLQCDTDRGYYATEAIQIGSEVKQICESFSQGFHVLFWILTGVFWLEISNQ